MPCAGPRCLRRLDALHDARLDGQLARHLQDPRARLQPLPDGLLLTRRAPSRLP